MITINCLFISNINTISFLFIFNFQKLEFLKKTFKIKKIILKNL